MEDPHGGGRRRRRPPDHDRGRVPRTRRERRQDRRAQREPGPAPVPDEGRQVMALEKIVVVTRKTRLEGLIERFNSRAQAKFYLDRSGGDFSDYEREDATYRRAVGTVRRALGVGVKIQVAERSSVPTMMFTGADLLVAVGQDGLVANTAKYVGEQPIVAVNPDPGRFDGVLLRYAPEQARAAVLACLDGKAAMRRVTLAEAAL